MGNNMEKKYKLVNYEAEEGKLMLEKFTAFMEENMCDVQVHSSLGENNQIIVKPILFKKVLIPEMITPDTISPIQPEDLN